MTTTTRYALLLTFLLLLGLARPAAAADPHITVASPANGQHITGPAEMLALNWTSGGHTMGRIEIIVTVAGESESYSTTSVNKAPWKNGSNDPHSVNIPFVPQSGPAIEILVEVFMYNSAGSGIAETSVNYTVDPGSDD